MQRPESRHARNARRPLLPTLALLALAAFAGAGAACSSAPLEENEGTTQADELRGLEAEEADFLRLLNAYRAQSGLGALTATPLLNQVAYDHSLDMGTRAYFDHTNPEGLSPFDRMRKAGYTGGAMAENIAAGNATGANTFTQWKNSDGHNKNMLGTRYRAIGIGRAYVAGSPYRYYWTTVFGDVVDGSKLPDGGVAPDAGTAETGAADTGAADAAAPDTGTDGGVIPEKDAGAGVPDAGGEPGTCDGLPGQGEVEPNDRYTTPGPLGARVCAALTAGDQDWYTFSVPSSGVPYDVRVASQGNAQLTVWRFASGRYSQMRNVSSTRVTGTSSSAGSYVLSVRSPTGTAQPYTITRGP